MLQCSKEFYSADALFCNENSRILGAGLQVSRGEMIAPGQVATVAINNEKQTGFGGGQP